MKLKKQFHKLKSLIINKIILKLNFKMLLSLAFSKIN